MRWLAAAAALAVLPVAAQDEARWGPVAEGLGTGSGICPTREDGGENFVCAVVLCEEASLTLGVLGTGHSGGQPPFRGRIEIDGQAVERDMESRLVMEDFLHVRTPIEPGDPLWQRLRAGGGLALSPSPEAGLLEFSLRGSAAELDRLAETCR